VARQDRQFAQYRAEALANPVTRANQPILPKIELPGFIALAVSVNL
jgi:hypothetical protein